MIDKILLSPYYLTLKIRHWLYDSSKLKSYRYDVPVISIGNITVGGTGKTPHAELVIEELMKMGHRVALISRGYGRKGKGYREVQIDDRYEDVGDEPLQIKRKFPSIIVAVDSSRKRAIDHLLSLEDSVRPTIFVLDDAFQHREIIPSASIVLVDYSRPVFQDRLLPLGRLRDLPSRITKADIVIVTKVPWWDENPDKDLWRKKLHLREEQKLYFSRIEYCDLHPVFPESGDSRYIYSPKAVLFSGIANSRPFIDYLVGKYQIMGVLKFMDHRNYTPGDISRIESLGQQYPTAAIITTEKDTQRLRHLPYLSDDMKRRLLFLQIRVQILPF